MVQEIIEILWCYIKSFIFRDDGSDYYKIAMKKYHKNSIKESHCYLKKAILFNYSQSYYRLGGMYYFGKGSTLSNFKRAYYYYSKSANFDLRSKSKLASMLLKGYGCQVDIPRSIRLCREVLKEAKQTSLTYIESLVTLAKMYSEGNYKFDPSEESAIRLFQKAINYNESKLIKFPKLTYDSELCTKEEWKYGSPFFTNYLKKPSIPQLIYKRCFFTEDKKLRHVCRHIAHSYKTMKKFQTALYYYTQSALYGCVIALEYIGEIFSKGWGLPRCDEDVAFAFYEEAKRNNSLSVGYKLGYKYQRSNEIHKSVKNYCLAIGEKSVKRDFQLVPYEVDLRPSNKNKNGIVGVLKERIIDVYFTDVNISSLRKRGAKTSSYLGIGNLYFHKKLGKRKLLKKSIWYYYKAALLGKVKSMKLIGNTFLKKKKAIPSRSCALIGIRFNHQASKRKYYPSEWRIGVSYLYILRNYKKALYWINQSVRRNNVNAINTLALMYDLGRGVSKDTALATKYFEKGAEMGNEASMYQLGIRYYHGWDSIEIDIEKGIKHFKIASRNGHTSSTLKLADIFFKRKQYNQSLFYHRLLCSQEKSFTNWRKFHFMLQTICKLQFTTDLFRKRNKDTFGDIVIIKCT